MRYLCVAALVLWLYGCGSTVSLVDYYFEDLFGDEGATIEKDAASLALEGVERMRSKDYDEALEAFQKLKERYPYSKFAILAELKVGDAYFAKKEYADAVIAYEEFVRLHPRNEVVPYVLYQIGMCHFLAYRSIDRDQEETQLAMDAFKRLMQAFPGTTYARKAKQQVLECQKRIAAKEFYVGQFYYRLDKHKAARERLAALQTKYPEAVEELHLGEDIEKMLERSEEELAKGEPKKSIWTRLGF